MKANAGKVTTFLIALLLGGLAVAWVTQGTPAQEGDKVQRGGSTGGRYTVVETEGHNLIVTDNKSNVLYFYTIDRDAEIGSDLKLRGTIDLNQVGKSVIQPTLHSKKKLGGGE